MTNVKNNDDRVLKLKALADEKRVAIAENNVASKYLTSKILVLDGITYNLNVMNSMEEIVLLMAKIGSLAAGLGVFVAGHNIDSDKLYDNFKVSGYHLDDWAEDVQTRLQQLQVKEDKALLAKIEKQLDKLLSEEKKTELELDELEKLLQ